MRKKDAERVLEAINFVDTYKPWHDLKKNPDDLPRVSHSAYVEDFDEVLEYSDIVLIIISDELDVTRHYELAYLNITDNDWYPQGTGHPLKLSRHGIVRAWKYVTPFKEEEAE